MEQGKLARIRREISRMAKSADEAQEYATALLETDWEEVSRIDRETRKVNCDGCSRVCLHQLMLQIDEKIHYCPDCDAAVKRGFICTCSDCKRKFTSYEHTLYRNPKSGLPFTPGYPRCPECLEKFRRANPSSWICLVCKKEYSGYTYLSICLSCQSTYGIDQQSIRKEYQKVNAHILRATALNLPATLTLGQWFSRLIEFDWLCAYCLTLPYENVDHFIPLCKGGGTVIENVVPSCKTCNKLKNQHHPDKVTSIPYEDIQRIRVFLSQPKLVLKPPQNT